MHFELDAEQSELYAMINQELELDIYSVGTK